MSGWERPTSSTPDGSPPRSTWAQPSDAETVGPVQLIRSGWRLYRSTPRSFLQMAVIVELIRGVLAIPGFVVAALAVRGVIDVFVEFLRRVAADPEAYRSADSSAIQAELETRLQAVLVPGTDLAGYSAVAGGAGIAIALLGTSALTAMALAATAGRPISVAGALGLVASRGGLLKPIVALGIGWVAVSLLPIAVGGSTGVQTWAGAPGSPRSVLIGSLLSILALVVLIGVIVLAVRWALFIPAVLVERLGVGSGLARAAQLTRGIRARLCLAMVGIALMQALSVGFLAVGAGIAVGLSAGSTDAGFGTYLAVSLVGSLLWAPLLPAMLTAAYRERTRDAQTAQTTPG